MLGKRMREWQYPRICLLASGEKNTSSMKTQHGVLSLCDVRAQDHPVSVFLDWLNTEFLFSSRFFLQKLINLSTFGKGASIGLATERLSLPGFKFSLGWPCHNHHAIK